MSLHALLLLCLGLLCSLGSWAQGCKDLKVTAPRGLQCLHCTHPKAERAALSLVTPLLDSCLKNLALGYVVDSSFGNNFSIITKMTARLIAADRNVHLHFYLLNGPAQRRFNDHVFPHNLFQVNPVTFRSTFISDKKFQTFFTDIIRNHLALFTTVHNLGATISLSPMLEDNFDNQSFLKSISLTESTLPTSLEASLVRNPCRDCFPGNSALIPKGIVREEHRGDSSFSFRNGFVSNDGWAYIQFPGEKPLFIKKPAFHTDKRIEKAVSLSQLRAPLLKASSLNNTYLLWISKYQATLPGNKSIHVNKRRYPTPKPRELRLIAKFLKG